MYLKNPYIQGTNYSAGVNRHPTRLATRHETICSPFSADMADGAPNPQAMPLPRASSEELISLANDASTCSISRTGSVDSWWRKSGGNVNRPRSASRRTMRRLVSEEELQSLASAASTIRRSRCGSSVSRSDSSWRVREWPAVDDEVVASGKQQLRTFDLDATALPTDVLCHLALEMFASAGRPAGLTDDRVRRFILAVRASMLDNSYHNFYHVFDVMQTTNALATATGTMARLDAWERFALLSAALCHDLEHPGVTSQFLSKTGKKGDATRIKYRGIVFRDALLEKHHALRALELMCDIGILDGLSSSQYYQFRSSVSQVILATDLTRHGEYLEHLKEFAARRTENPAAEMHKQLAMELMVKCADISNVVKPTAVARRWALRVTEEFFLQGDAERTMGMDISPACDRLATSRVALQTGFIDYFAGPLFTALAAAFPREGLNILLAQLRHNRALYALCSDLDLEGAREPAAASRVAPHRGCSITRTHN